MFDVARTVTDCPDPKDNKFLELAETSGAELIIASDPHCSNLSPRSWFSGLLGRRG
jgi:predicted nucleic acid-binding protein